MEATTRLLDEGRRCSGPADGWRSRWIAPGPGVAARPRGERGWEPVAIHKDLFGRERYLLAQRSATR